MKKTSCILFTFLALHHLNAQDNAPSDTIGLARNNGYQKNFTNADKLLTQYNINHTNIDALRLHAQVLYWTKEFDRSIIVYEKALQLFPEVSIVQLDYGRILFELNRLSKAQQLLKQYLEHDPSNAEANIMLARIELWNGKIASAKNRAFFLLKKYPGNPEAIDIGNQIQYITSPYIRTGIQFISDDQPLKGTNYQVETGIYRSWLFAPVAGATFYQFKLGDSSFHSAWFHIANTIQLGIKSSVTFGGGIFQQNSNEINGTGAIEFSQKIEKGFSVQAGFERKPYQYSAASIKIPVLEDVATVSLNYNLTNKWLGKAGYEQHHFQDDGSINSGYFWLLAPIVFHPNFSLSGGYAFSIANANKNNFTVSKSLAAIVNSTPLLGIVQGIYTPYFTPKNQQIHSVLASLRIALTKSIEFTSRGSVAITAKAENPLLTLEKTGNQYYIGKAFSPINYTPVTWASELRLSPSNKLSVSATYSYNQLLFYTSNQGSLQLKYLFLK